MIRSLRWRMLVSSLVLVTGITIASSVVLGNRARSTAADELEMGVTLQARAIAEAAAYALHSDTPVASITAVVESLGDGRSVTVVDTSGDVIFASNVVAASTADGLEVQRSLEGHIAGMSRDDPSTGVPLIHVAAPITVEGLVVGGVRVSSGTDSLPAAFWGAVRPTIIIGASALAALVAFSVLFTGNLTRALSSFARVATRLAAGRLHERAEVPHISEADPLAHAINDMAIALESQVQASYQERDTFGAVIDSMTDALIMVDVAGQVAVANPAALSTFGISPGEAIHNRLMQVVRDYEIARLVSAAISDGRQHAAQISYGQDRRPLEVSATPMERHGGVAVLLITRDLSELYRLERVRREFVANVSHELRTPLASVKASVETLQGAAANDPAATAEFLEHVNTEVDQMSSLVQELLDLATLEAGKAQLAPAPTDMTPLINSAADRVRPRASRQGISIEVDVPASLPVVLADRPAVDRVMQNLLDNALKFTPPDGHIDVTARASEEAVEVSVADTGEGILPEHLPHVFERFYKTDPSRSTVGTGLGLALVKHTVQALGGTIEARSQPGEGSVFLFTLPKANGRFADSRPGTTSLNSP